MYRDYNSQEVQNKIGMKKYNDVHDERSYKSRKRKWFISIIKVTHIPEIRHFDVHFLV